MFEQEGLVNFKPPPPPPRHCDALDLPDDPKSPRNQMSKLGCGSFLKIGQNLTHSCTLNLFLTSFQEAQKTLLLTYFDFSGISGRLASAVHHSSGSRSLSWKYKEAIVTRGLKNWLVSETPSLLLTTHSLNHSSTFI